MTMFGYYLDNIIVIIGLPLCILGTLIVHEWAHYLVGRACGMKVASFSVGIGRKLWQRKDRHGTVWSIRLFPVGGFVQISDMNEKALPLRLVTTLAGPLSNIILPFFLFTLFFLSFGEPVAPTVITAVEKDMPAWQAGLQPGDEILAINGNLIEKGAEIRDFTHERQDRPMIFKIRRGANTIEFPVEQIWREYTGRDGMKNEHGQTGFLTEQLPFQMKYVKAVGGEQDLDEDKARALITESLGRQTIIGLELYDLKIHPYLVDLDSLLNSHINDKKHGDYNKVFLGAIGDNYYRRYGPLRAISEAFLRAAEVIGNVARVPLHIFPVNRELTRPDAVVSERTAIIKRALYNLVFTTSVFSVFLGFINLLPFPGLDGGVVLVNVAEALAGGEITRKKKATLFVVSIMLIYGGLFMINMPDLHDFLDFKINRLMSGGEYIPPGND